MMFGLKMDHTYSYHVENNDTKNPQKYMYQ